MSHADTGFWGFASDECSRVTTLLERWFLVVFMGRLAPGAGKQLKIPPSMYGSGAPNCNVLLFQLLRSG